MSETWRKQYRGMCERGTVTLAGIDAAETKKLLTAAEATDVRSYWHQLLDVVGLAATVAADRTQSVSWDGPVGMFHQVQVTRRAGGAEDVRTVAPLGDPLTFAAPADTGEVAVEFSAQVITTGTTNGTAVTTSAMVPAAPAPPQDPAPAEPAAQAPAASTTTPDAPADGAA